ncbi:MAG: DNA repair protein RadC, partial [Butyrivibrio sp.]|nr:DNA repair protein RadC [Butyrivibrio sp.]
IAELSKRMSAKKAEISLNCTEPSAIAEYYMERLRHEEQEKALLLCLNSQLRLIDESVLSIGCVSSAYVSPRDVFMHAVRAGAAAIILLHNHPGGNPHPSKSDVEITNKIRQSGNMLGIILQDHIIIGDKSYYSFAREGLMWY